MGKYFKKEALSTGAKVGLGLGAAAILAPAAIGAAAIGSVAAYGHTTGYIGGKLGLPKVTSIGGGPWGPGGWNAGNKSRKSKKAKQRAQADNIARKQLGKKYGPPKLAEHLVVAGSKKEIGKALGIGTAIGLGATALTGAALIGGAQYGVGKALGRTGAPGITKYVAGPPGFFGYNKGAKNRRVAKAKKRILKEEYGK